MVSIVMEDKNKILALKDGLPKNIKSKCRFWASQDEMNLASLARNIAIHEHEPVVVVYEKKNGHTTEGLWDLVGRMSGVSRCRVFPLPRNSRELNEKVIMAVKELYERN
jgi:hypothetical protein